MTKLLEKHENDKTISIHTPAKGVTLDTDTVSFFVDISIHTPAKGVTEKMIALAREKLFQSTLPRREWRVLSVNIEYTF